MNLNIEILKCHHGVPKTTHCDKCAEEKNQYKLNTVYEYHSKLENKTKRIPIYRGCSASLHGGCFCTGACKEIIAYRDPIPGEIV
jgi:hypothetical protein